MRTAWWWVATWLILVLLLNSPTSQVVPHHFCRRLLRETYGKNARTSRISMDSLSNSASSQVASGQNQVLASMQVATKASTPLLHYLTRSFNSTISMVQMTSTSQTWTTISWNAQPCQLTKMRWSTPPESASDATLLTILWELHALLHREGKLKQKLLVS